MKNKVIVFKTVFAVFSVLAFAGCASSPSERTLAEQARAEPVMETSTQAKASLQGLIQSSQELSISEKNELSILVHEVYEESTSHDILTNQKKALLVKELLLSEPGRARIAALRSSIREVQKKRTDGILLAIDKMCAVVRLHPQIVRTFSEKLSTFERK